MAWYDILGGVFDAAGKLFGVGYNAYTNQRDFDYQKSLQQQIFQREDTAVQRRMADLEAAGLNPNLAAGSAAQAGGVVSRSNTNDLNIGSMLDTVQAINNVKLQRQERENKAVENKILENQAVDSAQKAAQSVISSLMLFGYNPYVKYGSDDPNDFNWYIGADENGYGNLNHYISGSPFQKFFDYEKDSAQYQKEILEYQKEMSRKQNDWFTANQILNSISSVAGDIADIGGLFKPKFMKK